jgi:hypothetical protein
VGSQPDLPRRLQHRPGRRSALPGVHVHRPDARPGLAGLPRTIFDTPGDGHFYDQVAWFVDSKKGPALSLVYESAGSFDFVPLWEGALTLERLSWRISDHYPLWTEFSLR